MLANFISFINFREIIDESDVFIDVHKAIRRIAPAPKVRIPKAAIIAESDDRVILEGNLVDIVGDRGADGGLLARTRSAEVAQSTERKSPPLAPSSEYGGSPKNTFVYRRSSSSAGNHGPHSNAPQPVVAPISPEMMAHFKHLGPSNLASKPKQTRYNTVKIKPGSKEDAVRTHFGHTEEAGGKLPNPSLAPRQGATGVGSGKDATNGGAQTIRAGYGGVDRQNPEMVSDSTQTNFKDMLFPRYDTHSSQAVKCGSQSTLGSLRSRQSSRSPNRHKGMVRSGSISENVIDVGGIRKVVLETTSSSEDVDEAGAARNDKSDNGLSSSSHTGKIKNDSNTNQNNERSTDQDDDTAGRSSGKKRRRRKRKKADEDETAPLLEGKR
jgi:metal transporter CNNM